MVRKSALPKGGTAFSGTALSHYINYNIVITTENPHLLTPDGGPINPWGKDGKEGNWGCKNKTKHCKLIQLFYVITIKY